MSSKPRCLFLSFSGAVYALRRRQVNRSDFQDALFWVGCTREVVTGTIENGARHAFGSYFGTPPDNWRPERQLIPFYVFVRESVLMAEKQGRVVWREPGSHLRTESIEVLLKRFGYNTDLAYEQVVKQPGAAQLFGWTRDEAFRRHDMLERFGWRHLDLRVFEQWGPRFDP